MAQGARCAKVRTDADTTRCAQSGFANLEMLRLRPNSATVASPTQTREMPMPLKRSHSAVVATHIITKQAGRERSETDEGGLVVLRVERVVAGKGGHGAPRIKSTLCTFCAKLIQPKRCNRYFNKYPTRYA